MKKSDITGKIYGNLTAVSFDHWEWRGYTKASYWKFRCNKCGYEFVKRKANVVSAHTKLYPCCKANGL